MCLLSQGVSCFVGSMVVYMVRYIFIKWYLIYIRNSIFLSVPQKSAYQGASLLPNSPPVSFAGIPVNHDRRCWCVNRKILYANYNTNDNSNVMTSWHENAFHNIVPFVRGIPIQMISPLKGPVIWKFDVFVASLNKLSRKHFRYW